VTSLNAISPIGIDVTVPCLSICLSVTIAIVYCAQTAEDIDTISFAYDSPMSVPDLAKIWLHGSSPFSPNFASVIHRTPVDLSVGDIWHIAAEWLR